MSNTEEYLTLSSKDAIKHVADFFGHTSLYSVSQALSDATLTVQPIQIKKYLNGSRMSQKVADRFFETYGVIISDVWSPGVLNGERKVDV